MRLRLLSPLLILFSAACAGGIPASRPAEAPRPATNPEPPTSATAGAAATGVSVSFTVIADSIPEEEALEALVAPYRERMERETGEVIGRTEVPLTEAVPEGTLGNFAADAMLWAARRHASEPVDMALTNNGGLRVPIPPGPITLGQMFEVMPFENMLSLLTLSGAQVVELANQIAAMRGEPIAGFSFRIQEEGGVRRARDIRVAGEPVDPQARYRLVTNDYLANGGGTLTPLHNALAREDLPVLIRDAFTEYVRAMGVIDVELEGRITGGIGS